MIDMHYNPEEGMIKICQDFVEILSKYVKNPFALSFFRIFHELLLNKSSIRPNSAKFGPQNS